MAIDRAIALGLYHGRLWRSVGALEIMAKPLALAGRVWGEERLLTPGTAQDSA
jgi:hypothetical protein